MLPKGTGQRMHTINICSWMSKGVVARRGPLPGPESRLSSNTRKWTVQGDTYADKARESIGKGSPSGEQEGKGTQENCSATWLEVGFYDDGISFQIVFNQSFWLRVLPGEQVHALFSQDGCIKKDSGRWLDTWCHFFDLSWTHPVDGGLLVPWCFLSGLPVVKQFMQMVTMGPGQGGWFQSVCFP